MATMTLDSMLVANAVAWPGLLLTGGQRGQDHSESKIDSKETIEDRIAGTSFTTTTTTPASILRPTDHLIS
ncbi:MAG: hypothetical protein ACYC3X_25340 [Pirellulaceae bacterium]